MSICPKCRFWNGRALARLPYEGSKPTAGILRFWVIPHENSHESTEFSEDLPKMIRKVAVVSRDSCVGREASEDCGDLRIEGARGVGAYGVGAGRGGGTGGYEGGGMRSGAALVVVRPPRIESDDGSM